MAQRAIRQAIFILCSLVILASTALCQGELVVSVYVDPFPSPYLSDWEVNPAIASAQLTNITDSAIIIRTTLTITHSGFGEIGRVEGNDVVIPPGEVADFNLDNLVDWNTLDYSTDVEEITVRTGRLPEGEYELCLTMESTGSLVINETCVSFTIIYPDPPTLIMPFDGDNVEQDLPLFQWLPVNVPPSFMIRYDLRIAELYDGQVASHALDANTPHFHKPDITEPFLQYPLEGLPFEKGKTYCWQVQVLDDNGYPPASNEGKSDIATFTFNPDGPMPESRAISGTVRVTGTSRPVSNTRVVLHFDADSTTTHTNDRGRYSFGAIPNNIAFRLTADKSGYRSGERSSLSEQEVGDVSDFDVFVTRSGGTVRTLAGVIKDAETSASVAGATVAYEILSRVGDTTNYSTTDSLWRQEVVADQYGRFEFVEVYDSTRFKLSVSRPPAYNASEITGLQYGSIDSLVILLDPAPMTVVGTVKTTVGGAEVGVGQALVRLIQTDQPTNIFSCYSQDDGSFEIDSVLGLDPDGRPAYTLSISSDKYLPYTYTTTINSAPGDTVFTGEHLLDARTGVIKGTIVSENSPVSGAFVYLYSSRDSSGAAADTNWINLQAAKPKSDPIMFTRSDARGNYVLPDILINDPKQELDKYRLWIEADGFKSACKGGRLDKDGDTLTVNFDLLRSKGIVHGLVVDLDRRGISKARVELYQSPGVDDIGQYVANLLGGGTPDSSFVNEDFNGDGVRDITDITYLVQSYLEGKTLADSTAAFVVSDWVETDNEGYYTLNDIDTGLFRLHISRPGYQSKTTSVVPISYGDEISRVDSLSSVTGSVDLKVVYIKGKDTTAIGHAAITSQVWTDLYSNAYTDDSGRFVSHQAPVGKIPIRILYPGYIDADTLIEIKEGDTAKATISLAKLSGTLKIVVIDSVTNKPLPNFDVIFGKDTSYTDMGGRVEFKDAPVGTDTLTVKPPEKSPIVKDYVVVETPVRIRPLIDTTYTIKMVPAARMSGTVLGKAPSGTTTPLAKALVTIEGNSGLKTTTDKDGKWTLRNVPAGGKVTVVGQMAGYKTERVPGWSVDVGDHIENIQLTLEKSPLDSLFGFAIAVDSITTSTGGLKKVSGALINIPATFGLKPKSSDARLYFTNVELDSLMKPVSESIVLKTSQLDVSVFGFDGTISHTGGLRLENIHFDSLTVEDSASGFTRVDSVKAAGRISGSVTIKDALSKVFPDSKFGQFTIPKKAAPSLWAGGVNRGLQKYGITADSTEAKMKLWAVTLGVDYVHTTIDTGGFHFWGSIAFGEKFKVAFENLNIGRDDNGKIAFKAITVKTDPPPQLPLGFVTVIDSSFTWNETGVWLAGAVEFTKWNKAFGIENVHIRQTSKAPYVEVLSAAITGTEEKSSVTIYGQQFTIKRLEFGTDNWETDTIPNEMFVNMAGAVQLSVLDKPVELDKLKITLEKWEVSAKVSFNQSRTFAGVVTVSLGHIEFDKHEEKGPFIGFSAGLRFGAIKGVEIQASNFKIFTNGPPEFDRVGFAFFAGAAEVRLGVGYADGVFEGDGYFNVSPIFGAGAEFRYGGLDDWWVRIISGVRIPLGPAAEIVQVSGGLGLRDNVWKVSIGGRVAPMKADMAVALDMLAEIYITPKGPIVLGQANVLVGGSLAVGKATIELNFPERLIAGSIMLGIKKGPLEANAQVDLGVKFVEYWYVHGHINVKLFEVVDADAHIVLAQNWSFTNRGKTRIVNGLYMEGGIAPIDLSGDYFLVGYGLHIDQSAYLDIPFPWPSTLDGAFSINGSAYAFVGIPNFLSARIDGSLSCRARVYNQGSVWHASGNGSFALSGYAGVKCSSCNSTCWKCVARKWGVCWWKNPGYRFCRTLDATFNYVTNQGFSAKVTGIR